MDDTGHIPVLADHVLGVLAPQPGQTYLDCTLGRGGHAWLLAPRLAPGGRIIGLDADPRNIAFAQERLSSAPVHVDVRHANFVEARAVLDELAVQAVDLLLADLGFASSQMDDPERGFSFQQEGPLDMRLDPRIPRTAADIVNHTPQDELANLIYRYGEERLSRKIARKIVEAREQCPILTTSHLAEVVRAAFGRHGQGHKRSPERSRAPGSWRKQGRSHGTRIDPATRTFMALRIAVNGELEALEHLLASLPALLRPGGIAAVISFHSLEDRMVKQAFRSLASGPADGEWQLLTRKPLIANDAEVFANPRSRSAKLRAIRWTGRPSAR